MDILNEVYVIEKKHHEGELILDQAYNILRDHWENVSKDRAVSLHLIFLAWYGLAEPAFLTGFQETDRVPSGELQNSFHQVYNYLIDTNELDAEFYFVVGLMASIFPFYLGDESHWEEIGKSYLNQYQKLAPNGFPSTTFTNQGLYGEYFSHQLKGYSK